MGATIWRVDDLSLNFGTTPAAENGVVYVPDNNLLYALNASTGATIWKRQVNANTTTAFSPIVANGIV